MERKNKTWEGKKKKRKRRKGKENVHRREGENVCLIVLLSVGDKLENFKLIFNTINCLMKHNNLPY